MQRVRTQLPTYKMKDSVMEAIRGGPVTVISGIDTFRLLGSAWSFGCDVRLCVEVAIIVCMAHLSLMNMSAL